MFNKPTFGTSSSGFGSFNSGSTAAASPFGGFKPAGTTSAFGAPPSFGAAAAQPATGGLFGASNTSTSLFGASTSAAAPAFGATQGFGSFGAGPSTGGLFGSNTTSTGLFGNAHNTSAFGAKPQGFGFGQTSAASTSGGGLFGAPQTAGGLFGQPAPAQTGGLFASNTSTFGQQPQASGTAHVKYSPVVGTDTVAKSGTTQSVNIKHHCITCMKEYEGKSLEELRLEDYQAGRKGSSTGVFGFQQTEQKPLFPSTNAFGQPAATTASSVFGGGLATTAFPQSNTFSFGGGAAGAANTSGGLFGAAKPAFGATNTTGGGLFGATTTQAPSFGTSTAPSFGFGSNTQNQQTGGLFGAKPATGAFGAGAGAGATAGGGSAFGGFGAGAGGAGGGLFGAKPLTATTAPTFTTTTPAFGGLGSGGFGASTTGGGLFGANTFGKPQAAQPAFSFAQGQQTLGGLGAGGGGSAFGPKPAAPAFGSLGGSLFSQPQTNTFSTGLDSGLGGGGMFNNSLSLGGLGAQQTNNNASLAGASAAGNVHEQILNLVARPYGDSPLFKDINTDSAPSTEALKPTNPAAMKAVLDANNYRMTTGGARLKLHHNDKKSLFDGLEESDASLEDKLSLKPSRKRLVLRPKTNTDPDAVDGAPNRSLEDQHNSLNASVNGIHKEGDDNTNNKSPADERPPSRRHPPADEHFVESIADRHGSWLNAPDHRWSAEKEKPIDGNKSTPRLYPDLEKERRASWLTTKPLRKGLGSQPDSAENSVRELCARTPDNTHDKENVDTFSLSVEEDPAPPRDLPPPPHPAGVKLTRPGYYTIPTLDEMTKYLRPDGSCVVPHLAVGRRNYGNVFYDCEIDVAGLDLDATVFFMNKEVTVYPDDSNKPPVGEGLNRRAIVTLDRIWPRDKTDKRPITDPDRLLAMDYEGKLRRVCDKHDTKFIEYRPQTGSWVFRVEHFSKYSLTDSDEEDEITPEVLRRQLVTQQLQTAAPTAPIAPLKPIQPVGLGGLGAPAPAPAPAPPPPPALNNHLYDMQMISHGKVFEMDTTEDNTESQSFYQDAHRAYGVKSPTSELARLEHRQSHNVQLMKASLYADADMEDNVSVSTGDQLVPGAPHHPPAPPSPPPSPTRTHTHLASLAAEGALDEPRTEEVAMKPLIVRPHTIVLKYHRKVPPFKKTIAGRVDAACIADMSICRARHSRVGFGVGNTLALCSTHAVASRLHHKAELPELDRYVAGRGADDWSEPVVMRLAVGGHEPQFLETITQHLDTLLEFSSWVEEDTPCPRLVLAPEPRRRRDALRRLADTYRTQHTHQGFGVSSAYCKQVFELCEALWGADLENDGTPGMDEASIVDRHRKLLEWMQGACSEATDEELKRTREPEPEDESDTHSSSVWTLMLGGRAADACRLAAERGDLNMAALIAQCAGDPTYRSLIARQLSVWAACGADTLVSARRLHTLHLLAGTDRDHMLADVDWLRALHATARYLCAPVPSVERVVQTYESLFTRGQDGDGEDVGVDLSALEPSELGMRLPRPPYMDRYDVTVDNCGKQKTVLDLRYELIRARATNTRPKLHPPSYTPDPGDYSLCFVLGVWFGAECGRAATALAERLVAGGLWERALQVLLYHPHAHSRAHLVRSVLSRGAPARADTPRAQQQLALVRRLRVPERWLREAQAHRAKYQRQPLLEVEHLLGAEQWNAAHRVLLDELLPDAVLNDDLKSITPLVEQLNSAAQRHEVSGWDSGGRALYDYIHVCTEIRGLVEGPAAGPAAGAEGGGPRRAGAALESLRGRAAGACRALARLQAPTPAHRAARTEMGARLVQLALAAGEPAHHLAALLRVLALPPDTTAAASHKITSELAEHAADSCVRSAPAHAHTSPHQQQQQHQQQQRALDC